MRGFGRAVLINSSVQQMRLIKTEFKNYNGTNCVCIARASDALKYLQKADRVDLILLDILGMDMDVFELLPQIRSFPACVNSQIILCGPGNKSARIRESLLSTGADYYMIKPYNMDALFRCIEALSGTEHFLFTTVWDAAILRKMEEEFGSGGGAGRWYAACCLQCWLESNDLPQVKTVCEKLSERINVSRKGIESGIHRALQTMARQKGLSRVPSCGEWLASTAESIRREQNERSRRSDYEGDKLE